MLGKLLFLVLLAFVAVSATPSQYRSRHGKLQMIVTTPKAIAGFYYAENGSAIHFTSDRSGISITVLDTGEPLLVFPKPGSTGAVVSLVGTEFLLFNKSISGSYQIIDYVIPASLSRQVKNALKSHSPNVDQKRKRLLRKLDPDTGAAKQNAIEQLLASPELRLMEEAVVAMGTKENIQGAENPAALTFYMTVLRLVKWRNQMFEDENMYTYEEPPENLPHRRRRRCSWFWSNCDECDDDDVCDHRGEDDCCDSHPQCPGENCLGMCGAGCTCWSYVCGDCCWHQGCQDHDDCCDEYLSWDCLSLWRFDCDSYSC